MTLNQYTYISIIMFAFLNANTPWDYTLSLGSGYDSNVMRFSAEEIDNAGQRPEILGSSLHFDSFVNKIGLSLKKDLWTLRNKNVSVGTKFSISSYANTPEKRYWSGNFNLTYKWGAYKNLKYSLNHLDKFYLRHYTNKDISNSMLEACYFSDRDQSFALSHRFTKYSWGTIGVGFLQRYYTEPFTEFDLDIIYYKARFNFKLKQFGTFGFQINQGRAVNESHLGTKRPSSFDRSYDTQEIFIPLTIKYELPFIQSFGFAYRSEKRKYDAEDPNDVLHAGRSHNDKKFSFWFRKNIIEDVSIKISSRLRSRKTDSGYEWVGDLKSFNQLQFWINIEWDLVYDQY